MKKNPIHLLNLPLINQKIITFLEYSRIRQEEGKCYFKKKILSKNILGNSRRNFEKRKTFGYFHSGTHFGTRISKKLFSVIQEYIVSFGFYF
jgi:hypothetical protein